MPQQSISKRYNRTILQTVLLVLLVFSLGLTWFGLNTMEKELQKKLNYISGLAQTGLPRAIWNLEFQIINDTLEALFLDEDLVHLSVIVEDEVLTQRTRKIFEGKELAFFKQNADLFFYEQRSISFEGEEVAQINMVFSKQRFRTALIWNIFLAMALVLSTALIILARTLGITRKYIFKPLQALEESSAQITQGNLDTVIHYEVEDEIGRLGNAFDQMRLSIQSTLAALNEANVTLEDRVAQRTQSLLQANTKIMDSIEYASLIQNALLPDREKFERFFADSFDLWSPKDVVGGDIILLAKLRSEECVLMVIDCTGHGVPGAFVTMLVKAIERELVMQMLNSESPPSPSHILKVFNQSIKHLLKQDSEKAASNAGFDGAILCYNKAENVLRFAGAGSHLYCFQKEELRVIKGNKQSVGYTKIDTEYEYMEHTLHLDQDTQIYLTTDGYSDQPGGKKGLPFGPKRLRNLLQEIHTLPFPDQKSRLLEELEQWRGDCKRVDDVSLVGLKLVS